MKNKITRFLTSTGALLIAFVALQGSAAAQVTVYSDINFEGNSRTFNGDVANLTDQGFNDAISSIQIPRGEQWQFCQDVNYGGSCQTLQGSIADLRNINWNDRISSIRRVRGGGYGNRSNYPGSVGTSGYRGSGVTVFTNPNFGGRSASFNGDVADLRQYNLNDQITSIEIPNGETWEICQDIDFGNQCTTVSGNVADLRRMGWNDRISSMRRVSGSGYRNRRYNDGRYDNDDRYNNGVGTPPIYSNQRGLVFFDRPNFRGGTTLVTNNGATGAVPRAGSVQVRGGGVWRVCDNQGDCANVDRDVNDMRELGLNGRITSVREVNNRRPFPFIR
jgi:Beta/Gamma crystallin